MHWLLDVLKVRDAKSQFVASLRSEKLLDVLISLAMSRRHCYASVVPLTKISGVLLLLSQCARVKCYKL